VIGGVKDIEVDQENIDMGFNDVIHSTSFGGYCVHSYTILATLSSAHMYYL